MIHKEERPGDIQSSLADISKIKKQLNYVPGISVEEGLMKTVAWYHSQLMAGH